MNTNEVGLYLLFGRDADIGHMPKVDYGWLEEKVKLPIAASCGASYEGG